MELTQSLMEMTRYHAPVDFPVTTPDRSSFVANANRFSAFIHYHHYYHEGV